MTNFTKIVLVALSLFIIYALYVMWPTDDLGVFEKVRASGEINQNVNVMVDHSKGYERGPGNQIIGFYAKDKTNEEAHVKLQEPPPAGFTSAKTVTILGHMHGSNFVAVRLTLLK